VAPVDKVAEGRQNPAAFTAQDVLSWIKGTAFAVSSHGHFLTADHVVPQDFQPSSQAVFLTGTGNSLAASFPVRIVERFPKQDLLLLATDSPPRRTFIPLADPMPVPGATIATFGYPRPHVSDEAQKLVLEKRFASAMISGSYVTAAGENELQIDKNLFHGHSGGPVIAMTGYAVAVATRFLKGWTSVEEAISKASLDRDFRQFGVDLELEKGEDWNDVRNRVRIMEVPLQFSRASLVRSVAARLRQYGIPVLDSQR
jgi:hypothetical protein